MSAGVGYGVEFAQTDLVSNHTVFRDQESFRALLLNHDLPMESFSSFIHEATHHWCFVSPLGNALTFLYLSVAKKALQWVATEDMSQVHEAFDDLFTYEIAVSWLRPLNEGLAQFAEYDVTLSPGSRLQSPPLSTTMNHLMGLARRRDEAPNRDETTAIYQINDAIKQWRLSRQVIERKSELLLQPVESQGSSYLLGYLAVKQLWKAAARAYDELKDADLFLSFARKLLFADYALVADLLDRGQTPRQRGLKFGLALHERMEVIRSGAFASCPWSEWEALLRISSTAGPAGRATHDVADPTPFVFADSEEASERGMRLYDLFHAEAIHLMDLPAPKVDADVAEQFGLQFTELPKDWFAPEYFYDLLRQRYLMWLGVTDATWEALSENVIRVMVEGEVIIDHFKLPEDIHDDRLKDMKVNIYLDIYELYLVATVGNDEDIAGMRYWGEISEFARKKLHRFRLDRQQIVKDTKLVHKIVDAYVQGTNFREVVTEFWTEGGWHLLDATYRGFAFNFREELEAEFLKRGLIDVLAYDGDLIRNVAAVSLGASAELTPEMLQKGCADLTLDVAGTIRRLKELWPHEDYPLAGVDGDGFLMSCL